MANTFKHAVNQMCWSGVTAATADLKSADLES